MTAETIISICLGIGLAASVGFRVFLPLFVLSLAAYTDAWTLNTQWEWVGSTTALIVLGVATVVEIGAYYIPYIDNLLDSIAIPLATVAGTAVMVSTVANLSPEITWALAIIAGGGTAAAISGTSGTVRLGATATTGGLANPLVTTFETGTSFVLSILSVFLPIVGFLLAVLLVFIVLRLYKKIKGPKR